MTHHIDFSTPFIIDGANIAPVKVVKLFGVLIDSVLSLNTQASSSKQLLLSASAAEGCADQLRLLRR